MAYDEGLAAMMRDALIDDTGIGEQKMFGGLCFLMNGNMLCGVHKGGAMFRVGPKHYDSALDIPGVSPMAFTGRPMKGIVDVSDDAMADDAVRAQLFALARAFVEQLPAK